jgi:hypothetical protein
MEVMLGTQEQFSVQRGDGVLRFYRLYFPRTALRLRGNDDPAFTGVYGVYLLVLALYANNTLPGICPNMP